MGKFQRRVARELTIYVRALAWLNAVPKPAEGTARARHGRGEKITRMEAMERRKIVPRMPPNTMPHIVARLVEIGVSEAAGMGVVPLSWREIDAWCARTGIDLSPWEARLIRALSAEHVAWSRKAESENCPAPWRVEVTKSEKDAELAALQSVLG